MAVELKIPEIGESVTEVIIGEWLKNEEDYVERDEDVVVIESDKATVEIPAPEAGKLVKILKRSGETAAVGETIGRLESKEAETSQSKKSPPKKEKVSASEVSDKGKEQKEPKQAEMSEEETRGMEEAIPAADEKALKEKDAQSKSAKREKAEEEKEAPEPKEPKEKEVGAQGRESEVSEEEKETAKDEEAIKEPREDRMRPRIISREEASDGRKAEREHRKPDSEKPVPITTDRRRREEKVIPMTPIRRRIAERLVQAQQTTAFLTTFNEIDMSAVNTIRQRYQEDFQEKHDIRLGLMSFFVKASIEALKLIPQVNAEIRGSDIVYRSYYDIGVAVGGGKGLVVPVLRDADQMSFAEVEQAIQEFARKATKNQLKPADLEGGTFTISNGGIYGSLLSTPIINAPQSGILGMHAMQERPVVRDGQVVVRPMMYVALTYDHRLVDGREAVTFLKRIKECVEAPSRILLRI
ncbi:MAG TPA: dihydrolipoyllysine-residue succinyltransferase [Candidatus Binatia bacterium]|nr:dihydrolipoyllysine-residue succinyltransferase [Candidatus Binatia bacterium]